MPDRDRRGDQPHRKSGGQHRPHAVREERKPRLRRGPIPVPPFVKTRPQVAQGKDGRERELKARPKDLARVRREDSHGSERQNAPGTPPPHHDHAEARTHSANGRTRDRGLWFDDQGIGDDKGNRCTLTEKARKPKDGRRPTEGPRQDRQVEPRNGNEMSEAGRGECPLGVDDIVGMIAIVPEEHRLQERPGDGIGPLRPHIMEPIGDGGPSVPPTAIKKG